jgi:hypothetical protein
MKQCEVSDYEQRGFKVDEQFKLSLTTRICPDIPADSDIYKVKNLYDNMNERYSFS